MDIIIEEFINHLTVHTKEKKPELLKAEIEKLSGVLTISQSFDFEFDVWLGKVFDKTEIAEEINLLFIKLNLNNNEKVV